MATKKKRQSQWASDAALQALVRFGPEESGLSALAQQARADYGVSVRQAHGTAAGILDATQRAIPNVRSIYDRAGLDQARTASLVSEDLGALSGVANTIKAGAALEVAQQLGNLRSARASALEDLQTRQVAARQGEGFAVQQARTKFVSDMQKILARKQGVAQEKGAFTASTVNALAQKEADRQNRIDVANVSQAGQNARQEDQQSFTAGENAKKRAAAAKRAASSAASGGKLNTPKDHGRLKDQVEQLRAWIRQNKGDYRSRHEMANDLLQGVSPTTVTDPKSGQKVRDPGVPKAPGQLALSVALDLEYDRHISRHNVSELHTRRYSVNRLGYKGAAGTRRRAPARRTSRAAAAIPGLGPTLR